MERTVKAKVELKLVEMLDYAKSIGVKDLDLYLREELKTKDGNKT